MESFAASGEPQLHVHRHRRDNRGYVSAYALQTSLLTAQSRLRAQVEGCFSKGSGSEPAILEMMKQRLMEANLAKSNP